MLMSITKSSQNGEVYTPILKILISVRKTSRTKVFWIHCNMFPAHTRASWLAAPFLLCPHISLGTKGIMALVTSESASSGYIEHCRWVNSHPSFNFISDPWKGSYGGTCWPIWTWWGAKCEHQGGWRHHFLEATSTGIKKMSTLLKKGRLKGGVYFSSLEYGWSSDLLQSRECSRHKTMSLPKAGS